MLSGIAKILYDSITGKETLEEQQAEYVRLMSVKGYKKLYKAKVDAELIANGYEDIIVEI